VIEGSATSKASGSFLRRGKRATRAPNICYVSIGDAMSERHLNGFQSDSYSMAVATKYIISIYSTRSPHPFTTQLYSVSRTTSSCRSHFQNDTTRRAARYILQLVSRRFLVDVTLPRRRQAYSSKIQSTFAHPHKGARSVPGSENVRHIVIFGRDLVEP
jgi:hypothetical protein